MKKTVLIVDDIMINIDVLTNILDEDYTVMAAVSGESAIKILERKRPDLVLLDVSMPGIDGFGVLQYMMERSELASIPVILATGEYDVSVEERCLTLGAADYIKKPYNAVVIGVKVRTQLELKAYKERTAQLEQRVKQLEVQLGLNA